MTYEQMQRAANANFTILAANTRNASFEKFCKFPLELRIEMDLQFFITHCAN